MENLSNNTLKVIVSLTDTVSNFQTPASSEFVELSESLVLKSGCVKNNIRGVVFDELDMLHEVKIKLIDITSTLLK
ncbi:MAG: hypothetical protein WCK78_18130 [Paludibacter sp.]